MKTTNALQVGVKSLIFNNDGDVLVIKRSQQKYPGVENVWDIPGGRIDPESTLEENLKREVREETGLNPKILRIVAAQDIIKPEIRVVRLTYVSCVTGSDCEVKLSDEHIEFKWVPLESLLTINNSESYIRVVVKDNLSLIKDIVKKELDR